MRTVRRAPNPKKPFNFEAKLIFTAALGVCGGGGSVNYSDDRPSAPGADYPNPGL